MQVAYDYRHLAHRSAKCKRLSAVWRTSPRNARAFPPFGEPLREMQETFRRLAKRSRNLRETFVPLQTSPATCGRLSYPYIQSPATCGRTSYPYEPSPAICGRTSYPYKHLLQLAGDYRTPTYHLLQLAGDYRTPTNISCNLRETFVPLQKSASAFFSLMICASYRKPYFCFIKIQYPEEIIRKYTQLSR